MHHMQVHLLRVRFLGRHCASRGASHPLRPPGSLSHPPPSLGLAPPPKPGGGGRKKAVICGVTDRNTRNEIMGMFCMDNYRSSSFSAQTSVKVCCVLEDVKWMDAAEVVGVLRMLMLLKYAQLAVAFGVWNVTPLTSW
ncbi:hypothetical protein GW17_00042155 [Ensete ventricosum]|nr:hypothetical protein GW17_00042155 [Ensete ventricosum]